jgi:serine/threonine-protein kinase
VKSRALRDDSREQIFTELLEISRIVADARAKNTDERTVDIGILRGYEIYSQEGSMSEAGAAGSSVAGRYRLETLIGRGGMGVVWAARDLVSHEAVAIKFLNAPHEHAEVRHRFMREARAIAAVRHPNVVQVYDLLSLDDDTPAMVMELLRGETLASKLARQNAFSLEETADLLLPVVRAVTAAHAAGIVHRDLKPDNIFIARDASGTTTIKVLDFGIA